MSSLNTIIGLAKASVAAAVSDFTAEVSNVDTSLLPKQLESRCNKLLERTREAFLEARDETDARWIRERSVDALTGIFADIPVMTGEYALIKLSALQEIEREAIVGHVNAMVRTRKWRKALVDRYFGIRAV